MILLDSPVGLSSCLVHWIPRLDVETTQFTLSGELIATSMLRVPCHVDAVTRMFTSDTVRTSLRQQSLQRSFLGRTLSHVHIVEQGLVHDSIQTHAFI